MHSYNNKKTIWKTLHQLKMTNNLVPIISFKISYSHFYDKITLTN